MKAIFASLFLLVLVAHVYSQCETASGSCKFPFKYKGVSYTGCTDKDANGPWCATTLTTSGEYATYDYCPASCGKVTLSTPTGGCNTRDGQSCVFPFKYLGDSHTACTTAGFGGTFWCATAVNGNGEYTTYGICAEDCTVKETTVAPGNCATTDHLPCIFPFYYQGFMFEKCTTYQFGSTPWCPTSVTADMEANNYGVCNSNCEVQATGVPTTTTTTTTTTTLPTKVTPKTPVSTKAPSKS